MIAIETMDGSLVRVFKDLENGELGFHQFFGFISPEKAKLNLVVKKRQGFDLDLGDWLCRFKVTHKNGELELNDLKGCSVKKINADSWELKTPNGSFKVGRPVAPVVALVGSAVAQDPHLLKKTLSLAGACAALLMAGSMFAPKEETKIVETAAVEPVMVKIIEPKKVVTVKQQLGEPTITTQIAKAVGKKSSSMKSLGFLGLIGDKNLKKGIHGAPSTLGKATDGAGPGGTEGSGGESLIGLGEGLKKTTVGNSGVAGLGGIGTKGAGGGRGGYGNSLVASGNGKGLQELSIKNSDMILDGGLSKYAINATIAKYLNQVRRCYEDELKLHPALEGLVTVDFEVGINGHLNFARTGKTTLDSKSVQDCINSRMMAWEFPKPKGGVNVKVSYPFMLRPVGTL